MSTAASDPTVLKTLNWIKGQLEGGSSEATVVETYRSGSSWYRVWSDGFIEQGGISSRGSTVSFHKSFSNADYQLVFTGIGSVTNGTDTDITWVVGLTFTKSKSKSSFSINDAGFGVPTSFSWIATGY